MNKMTALYCVYSALHFLHHTGCSTDCHSETFTQTRSHTETVQTHDCDRWHPRSQTHTPLHIRHFHGARFVDDTHTQSLRQSLPDSHRQCQTKWHTYRTPPWAYVSITHRHWHLTLTWVWHSSNKHTHKRNATNSHFLCSLHRDDETHPYRIIHLISGSGTHNLHVYTWEDFHTPKIYDFTLTLLAAT